MTAATPRFARKETRQLARKLDEAGFVYVGDDGKGHPQYLHPSGVSCGLSQTPHGGQQQYIERAIAKAIGPTRGKFDRQAQRDRQAALRRALDNDRAMRTRYLADLERQRADEAHRQQVRRRVASRHGELRAIDHLMRSTPGHGAGRPSPI